MTDLPVGNVPKLERCYRCRKVFAARRDERYCPECRREKARKANLKRLGQGGWQTTTWAPIVVFAALVILGGMVGPWGMVAGVVCGLVAARELSSR